jgi:hypothetical protein
MLDSCQQYNNAVATDGVKPLVWMQKSNTAAEQQPLGGSAQSLCTRL